MVFEKIKRIMAEQLGINEEDITIDASFKELDIDSLDLFQIIIEIEEEFGVQIEDAESIKTVEEAVNFVEKKMQK